MKISDFLIVAFLGIVLGFFVGLGLWSADAIFQFVHKMPIGITQ